MIRSRLLRAGSLTACATLALLRAPTPPSTKRRTVHASSSSRTYLDDRYAHWRADVEAYEALEEPLVRVDASPGAGLGVFAKERIAAGTTITEYVGCLAPAATTRCDELELQQEFYGADWRKYSQRYEIGLAGTAVSDAGGAARGGTILDSITQDEYCDVDEPTAACVARAGAADFILLGKVPAQGACPEEGVAQLINDHTALKMPHTTPDRPIASAKIRGDGVIGAEDVNGLVLTSWHSRVPLAADVERIERVVRAYIARIETRNNVALCQAEMCETDDACDPVPRVFAVATRPIPAGAELRYTYGVEWWLAQLRRAALAQLVTCRPSPARAAALASVIRSIERVSVEALDAQAKAVGLAGSMPRAFVSPLEPLPPLDDLLYVDDEENWRRAILQEEFASAVECPVEDMYAQEFVAAPSEA